MEGLITHQPVNLDFLSVSTYAARYSAFNPIEDLWSPLSDMLAGVVFSPKLDGDTKPLCLQSQLSPDELREKEYAVFDNAISELSTFWKEAKFDGFPIQLEKIICGNDNSKWNDFGNVKRFFKAPVRDLSKCKELMVECNKMFRHLDHHLNEIVFIKCKDKTCCKEWLLKDPYNHLNQFKFRLPAPTKNKYHDGHHETFLQRCLNKEGKYGDEGQLTAIKADFGKCDKCQNYSYKFKTGKDRHNATFHRQQKTAFCKAEFDCPECGKLSTIKSALNSHKKKENHRAKRQDPPMKKQKTKQRTINDMLLQHASAQNEEDDDQENEPCQQRTASSMGAVMR